MVNVCVLLANAQYYCGSSVIWHVAYSDKWSVGFKNIINAA